MASGDNPREMSWHFIAFRLSFNCARSIIRFVGGLFWLAKTVSKEIAKAIIHNRSIRRCDPADGAPDREA